MSPDQLDDRVARRWWPLANMVLADQPAEVADLLTPERLEQHLELRISTEPRPHVTCDDCHDQHPADLPLRWEAWFDIFVYDDDGNAECLARIAGGLIGCRVTGTYDTGFEYWYEPDPNLDQDLGLAPILWPGGPSARPAPAW